MSKTDPLLDLIDELISSYGHEMSPAALEALKTLRSTAVEQRDKRERQRWLERAIWLLKDILKDNWPPPF